MKCGMDVGFVYERGGDLIDVQIRCPQDAEFLQRRNGLPLCWFHAEEMPNWVTEDRGIIPTDEASDMLLEYAEYYVTDWSRDESSTTTRTIRPFQDQQDRLGEQE